MIYIFLLTYNEQEVWVDNYSKEFVEKYFVGNNIHFIVLDNGSQPLIKKWCQENGFTYYASEYNIGSSGGYNWFFKIAYSMNLNNAIVMQADVMLNNAEPLIITNNLTKNFGDKMFFCWPQDLYEHWIKDKTPEPWVYQKLHNLGNLVGFNPKSQFKNNCYFDENYVVTHIDDVEFCNFLDKSNTMSYINVCSILNHTNHYFTTERFQNQHNFNAFVIEGPNYVYKVLHASQNIHGSIHKNEPFFHSKWLQFNREHYDLVQKNNGVRFPYDGTRWQKFGYPLYPVWHEIFRFFQQYPYLNINGIAMWSPNN